MAGDECGVTLQIDPGLGLQHAHGRERHRHQRGLRILGQRQAVARSLPDDRRQLLAERGIDLVEHRPGRRERIRQRLAHADGLAALPRKYECRRHGPLPPERCPRPKFGPRDYARAHQVKRPGTRSSLAIRPKIPITPASARPGRGLNGRPRVPFRGTLRAMRQDQSVRRPVSPPTRASSFPKVLHRSRSAPFRSLVWALRRTAPTEGRHDAVIRARLPRAPGREQPAGRRPDRPVQGDRRRRRRQGRQDRILGRQVPHLPHQEEPQGPFHADQPRRPAGRDGRDGAPDAHQRRRAALS